MSVTLALYPNFRGLNFVCIQMPNKVIDYGTIFSSPFLISRFLNRVEKYIDYYAPSIVALRYVPKDSYRAKQASKIASAISELAVHKGLRVYTYKREDIRQVFEIHGASTKHEIAQKIVSWIEDLAHLTPRPRKLWLPEDHRMGILDAAALAITHEHLTT